MTSFVSCGHCGKHTMGTRYGTHRDCFPQYQTQTDRERCGVTEDSKRCTRAASCRGWCWPHYARWRRNGDPTASLPKMVSTLPCAYCPPGTDLGKRGTVGQTEEGARLCTKHWERWRNHGDPNWVGKPGPAKLTEHQVRTIRAEYRPGQTVKLARRFFVTPTSIRNVVTGKTYGHLQ